MKRWRRIALPILLLSIGIYLLIGCIPIPATHQLQPDNSFRPEHAIGKGKPIELGKTHIEDAVIELTKRVTSGTTPSFMGEETIALPMSERRRRWSVSDDHRHFTIVYQLRTVTWLMPLCFHIDQQTESRYLTLDVNESGIVTATQTTASAPPYMRYDGEPDWSSIFDEPARRKLHDAGIFSNVDVENAQTQSELQHPELHWQPSNTRPTTP